MPTPSSYTGGKVVTALAIATTLLGSTAPSPLYRIYTEELGLAHAQTTMIFAIYAMGTLFSLLLSAWLSRYVSDLRRLLVPGLAITALGALIFGLADSLGMLLFGRFLNGFGTGAITGMGSAALIALSPPDRKHVGATIATVAFTGGAASGPLISSAALTLDLAPTLLPFLVIVALSVISILGFRIARWPADEKGGKSGGTAADRKTDLGLYILACLGIMTAWSISSAFMALGTDLAMGLYGFTSISKAGLLMAVFQLFGGLGQGYFGRRQSFSPMLGGFAGIAMVLAFLIALAGGEHPFVLVLAMPVFGLSYGAVFVQSLALAGAAAAPQSRPTLIAAFYVAGYFANALPTIILGIITDQMGLTGAFRWFSAVVICFAVAGAAFAFVARSRQASVYS